VVGPSYTPAVHSVTGEVTKHLIDISSISLIGVAGLLLLVYLLLYLVS